MDRYLLIESLDPFESNDVGQYGELAASLAREGNQVTLFWSRTESSPHARVCARRPRALAEHHVELLADEFSLRGRRDSASVWHRGQASIAFDVVIDRLARRWKPWH